MTFFAVLSLQELGECVLTYVAIVSHLLTVPAGYTITALTNNWTSSAVQWELDIDVADDAVAADFALAAAAASFSSSCLRSKSLT